MAKYKKLTKNINKDKFLNDLPEVHPEVSKWKEPYANYLSCNNGEIVPIYCDEVLPDEEREIRMDMTSHTTTPVAPIFPAQYTQIKAFAVPIRLCADLLNGYKTRKSPWVKVFGEDNASSGSTVVVPLAEQSLPSFKKTDQVIVDISSYLTSVNTENNVFNFLDYSGSTDVEDLKEFNYLKLAAYELIYQRHYRNENYETATESDLYKLLFDAYNGSKASVSLSSAFTFEKANREKDYFTGMKPFTLKGTSPVILPVGDKAPVVSLSTDNDYDASQLVLEAKNNGSKTDVNLIVMKDSSDWALQSVSKSGGTTSVSMDDYHMPSGKSIGGILYADLTKAYGISVEQLRILIKTQELLEKDAMYGSLYAESLNAHFGCCPIDETLQDPALLAEKTISTHMQAIFQTSSTSGESSILGTIGANSTTQSGVFTILPRTKFKEHCVIMICAVHKLQNVYDSRYWKSKFDFKKARFDFYTPELNDLGFQPVTDKEMRSGSGTVGYNEAFAEYRYKFNTVKGELAAQFPYWAPAIANEYASASALYKEDTAILDKALSVLSSTAPQFYDAWGFVEYVSKPMSLHSIPGFDGVI